MARKAPRSREQFSRVSGVGSAKLREFGDTFVEMITRYVDSKGLPRFYDPVETPFGRKSRPSVSDSARMTGELVSNGSTLEEASEQRGVKRSRVLAHLERLVNEGIEVELGHLMPSPARRQAIESAFETSGQLLLRPVMDLLGDGYDYEELRVVRLGIYQKRRTNGESPTHGVPHSGPVTI
jgi:ATP-dependent DNA helicase RecQ